MNKLPGPIELFTKAWENFELHWKTLIAILLVPYVLIAIAGLSAKGLLPFFNNPIIIILFVGAAAYLSLFSQVALLFAVKENLNFEDAFKHAKGKIAPYFWLQFLNGLIIAGGFVLLFIPGILFAVWFCLNQFVFVFDGERGLNALLKSKEYVRGYFWPVLGRIAFVAFLSILVSTIPGRLIAIFEPRVLPQIFNYLVGLVLGPVVVLYTYFLYDSLKKAKPDLKFTPTKGAKAALFAPLVIFVLGAALATAALLGSPNLKQKIKQGFDKIKTANPR